MMTVNPRINPQPVYAPPMKFGDISDDRRYDKFADEAATPGKVIMIPPEYRPAITKKCEALLSKLEQGEYDIVVHSETPGKFGRKSKLARNKDTARDLLIRGSITMTPKNPADANVKAVIYEVKRHPIKNGRLGFLQDYLTFVMPNDTRMKIDLGRYNSRHSPFGKLNTFLGLHIMSLREEKKGFTKDSLDKIDF